MLDAVPPAQPAWTKCGRSSAGRAPPCQGGCREFESRRPLSSLQLHSGSFRLRAIGAAVARFPDTEEVTGSIPVSPTTRAAPRSCSFLCAPFVNCGFVHCGFVYWGLVHSGPFYPVHLAFHLLSSGRTPLAPPPPPARVENARSDLAPRPKGGARGFT